MSPSRCNAFWLQNRHISQCHLCKCPPSQNTFFDEQVELPSYGCRLSFWGTSIVKHRKKILSATSPALTHPHTSCGALGSTSKSYEVDVFGGGHTVQNHTEPYSTPSFLLSVQKGRLCLFWPIQYCTYKHDSCRRSTHLISQPKKTQLGLCFPNPAKKHRLSGCLKCLPAHDGASPRS